MALSLQEAGVPSGVRVHRWGPDDIVSCCDCLCPSVRQKDIARVFFGLVASEKMSNRSKNGSLSASNDKFKVVTRKKKVEPLRPEQCTITSLLRLKCQVIIFYCTLENHTMISAARHWLGVPLASGEGPAATGQPARVRLAATIVLEGLGNASCSKG